MFIDALIDFHLMTNDKSNFFWQPPQQQQQQSTIITMPIKNDQLRLARFIYICAIMMMMMCENKNRECEIWRISVRICSLSHTRAVRFFTFLPFLLSLHVTFNLAIRFCWIPNVCVILINSLLTHTFARSNTVENRKHAKSEIITRQLTESQSHSVITILSLQIWHVPHSDTVLWIKIVCVCVLLLAVLTLNGQSSLPKEIFGSSLDTFAWLFHHLQRNRHDDHHHHNKMKGTKKIKMENLNRLLKRDSEHKD